MTWLQERLKLDSPILDVPLFTLAGTPITAATLVVFVVIIAMTFVVSRIVQNALARALRLRKVKDEGTIAAARRLTHYLVVAIGLGVGLQTIGINLSALFAAGAIFAIGLGFAMQNIMQNFVSGVILLTERTIKPGDILQVDQRFVRVQTMGIRATIARSLDEEEIIIPNSAIVQTNVTNYTLQDSMYRLRCKVGVEYSSDMKKVREVLEKTARETAWRIKDREPVILLVEFGSSSVDWEVSVWMDDPWSVRRAKSQMNEAIWWALKEAGITIAFPQLDLHLDSPVVDALMRRAS
jgi:small-conductance mechanosensitive channel